MRPVLAIVLLMLVETACQRSQPAPASPSPAAPSPSPASGLTLSGVVYEITSTGQRALAGVGIDVSPEYQSWPPETSTDANGHYEVAGAADLKVIVTKAGYSQPCRSCRERDQRFRHLRIR